jgi:hypothetical protein
MTKRKGCPAGQILDQKTGKCGTKNQLLSNAVKTHSYIKVDEGSGPKVIDVQSASAILDVKSKLSPENKRKMDSMTLEEQAYVAWSLVK